MSKFLFQPRWSNRKILPPILKNWTKHMKQHGFQDIEYQAETVIPVRQETKEMSPTLTLQLHAWRECLVPIVEKGNSRGHSRLLVLKKWR
jgi:hypothetical protein